MKNIIVIDSGFSFTEDNYKNYHSVNGISIQNDGKKYNYIPQYQDSVGHGSIVCNLLHQYLTKPIDLFVINIFPKSESAKIDLLIEALLYCDKYLNCDLIQISLGTLYYNEQLEKIIEKLTNKNILIVAAYDNEKSISYPAAMKSVLGVDINSKYSGLDDYDIICDNVIDVRGADVYYRSKGLNNQNYIVRGSSFYCCYIVAVIINSDLSVLKKTNVVNELKKKAKKIYNVNSYQHCFPKIEKAVVFPINKETQSIATFEDYLDFEVLDYFDIREKGLIKKTFCSIFSYIDNKKIIKNYKTIDWNLGFDTFICGHVGKISEILKYDVLDEIAEKCNFFKKKLICFDNAAQIKNKYPDLTIWYPYADVTMVPKCRYGKLRSPHVPILGIFGTSSKQGKMTLQLILRSALQKENIKVKNIGSEPESYLFGFEYLFAFGYEATDYLTQEQTIMLLNEAVYQMERKDCELIIVGSQSGTVPHQLRNIEMIPIKQYSFLLGTQPDAIILCVNSFDPIDYVERTVAFFHATVGANVIAICLSDFTKKSRKNSSDYVNQVQKHFGVPTFNLENLDVKRLVDSIVEYYQE